MCTQNNDVTDNYSLNVNKTIINNVNNFLLSMFYKYYFEYNTCMFADYALTDKLAFIQMIEYH